MAILTLIHNVIDVKDKTVSKIDGGLALFHLVEEESEEIEFVVAVNGKITEDYEYIVRQEDHVVIVPLPKGSGDSGKDALMIIAMIAITIATGGAAAGWFATSGGLFAAGSASAMALGAAISVGGGLLINSLASTPVVGNTSSTLEEVSATYGYGTLPNATSVGTALPIALGKRRVVPPVVNRFLSLDGDKQYLNVLMAVNDGEVDSISEIMLNDQPIDNFNNVSYEIRYGTNNQALLNTFRDSKSTMNLQRNLNTNGATTTYTTDGNSIQGLEVVMSLPSGLFKMNDAGTREAYPIQFKIRYRKEDTTEWFYKMTDGYQYFVYVYDMVQTYSLAELGKKEYRSFKGESFTSGTIRYKFVKKYAVNVDPTQLITVNTIYKTTQRISYSIPDLSKGRYEVEIIRVSNYSEDTRTANQLTLDYINEVVYDDFTYPNTALLSVVAQATDQLSNFPSISALVTNNTIKGTEYSKSNPAWACYDLLLREGISDTDIDLDAFEEWADYCDEENFTVALYLDSQQDLQSALNMVSIAGRATVVQFGSKFTPLVEKLVELPTQSFLFTSGNIIDSSFSMATIPYAERSNVVEVTFFDQDDDYNSKTEQVQAFDFDANTKEIKSSITLYGCTSQEIAKRYAKFSLNKNRYITSTVSFSASVDSIACSVGDVILVGVKGMTNTLADGRLKEVVGNDVVLDTFVSLEKDEIYELQIRAEDDRLISYDYTHTSDSIETDTLHLSLYLDIENPLDVVYSFGKQVSKSTNMYRVGSITRDSDFKRKITAIEYNAGVYEDDVEIEVEDVVVIEDVTNLKAEEALVTRIDGSVDEIISVSWEGNSLSYDVSLDGRKVGTTDSNSFVINEIFVKTKIYTIKVNDTQITYIYKGEGTPLSEVQNVSTVYSNGVYTIMWDKSEDILFSYYEIILNGNTYKTTNTFYEISTLPNGIYDLQIFTVNSIGEKSEATDYQLTIEDKTIGTIALEADTKVNQVVIDMNQNISRLDETIERNSESLVSTVETLNSSIETAEQSIDDLGNETLSNFQQRDIAIQESKSIAQSADGKWNANAGTMILREDGKLTQVNLSASEGVSKVLVSADNFEIETASGSQKLFTVSGDEIVNNTKVSFSSNPNIATKDDLRDLATVQFIPDVNNHPDVELIQYGKNNNVYGEFYLENSAGNDLTHTQYFTTKQTYKDGAIFSWEAKGENYLEEQQVYQRVIISVVDVDTDSEVFGYGAIFINGDFWGNEHYGLITSNFFMEGLESKYFTDNPTATASDYTAYTTIGKDQNGNIRNNVDAPLFFSSTFVYDDANFILIEDGLERFKVPTTSGRTLKVVMGIPHNDSDKDETDTTYPYSYTYKFSSSVDILKWDRYYNNSNVVSELADLTQSLTNLNSTTTNEQIALNNKILAEQAERLAQDALIDGKITSEEQSRLNALATLQTEYKNYTDVVTKAIADETLTTEEQLLIAEAQASVDLAKQRFAALETEINGLTKVEDISWQEEVQAAINNDETTIDAGKIVTNEAFVNNLNATGGIIAEDVTATDFYGKNFYGGYFEGSLIVGAVLKASYLDLDGELEVLTNYHITVAMYNANPSLYTDAVYTEASNEYRIPSLSTIRSSAGSASVLSTGIKPYNNANSNHNNKCVKIKPDFNISTSHKIFTSITYNPIITNVTFYNLYICGVHQAKVYCYNPRNNDNVFISIKDMVSGSVATWTANFNHTRTSSHVLQKTLSNGLVMKADIEYFYSYVEAGGDAGEYITTRIIDFKLYLESSFVVVADNFTSGELMTANSAYGTGHSPANIISINNLQ